MITRKQTLKCAIALTILFFGETPLLAQDTPETIPVDQYLEHIVILTSQSSSGSGFIGRYKNKVCLFTNLHVIDQTDPISARTIRGHTIPLEAFVSPEGRNANMETRDIAVFFQNVVTNGLEIMTTEEFASVQYGDRVAILGNSFGGQTVPTITGTIVAIGPETIETDAKAVSGNSGSPIIHLKTGKVVGIHTRSSIIEIGKGDYGADSKFNNVQRRFGCRIDTVLQWENNRIDSFQNNRRLLNQMWKRTKEADELKKNVLGIRSQRVEFHLAKDNSFSEPCITLRTNTYRPNISKAQWLKDWDDFYYSFFSILSSDLKGNIERRFNSWHYNRARDGDTVGCRTIVEDRKEIESTMKARQKNLRTVSGSKL